MSLTDMTFSEAQTENVTVSGPDPDAPHGRKPDGTPYQRSQEWRNKPKGTQGRRKPAGPSTAPPRRRTGSSKPSAKPMVTYADTVGGVMQMIAGGCMVLGQVMPVFKAHAVSITMHAPTISNAVESVAYEDSRVAAVLDRVGQVGPWGALTFALVPLGLQILANHRMIPTNPDLGIYDPADLLREAGIDVPDDSGADVSDAGSVPSE